MGIDRRESSRSTLKEAGFLLFVVRLDQLALHRVADGGADGTLAPL